VNDGKSQMRWKKDTKKYQMVPIFLCKIYTNPWAQNANNLLPCLPEKWELDGMKLGLSYGKGMGFAFKRWIIFIGLNEICLSGK
jgi:hypothetical protein